MLTSIAAASLIFAVGSKVKVTGAASLLASMLFVIQMVQHRYNYLLITYHLCQVWNLNYMSEGSSDTNVTSRLFHLGALNMCTF